MPPRTISGSPELGAAIRASREKLDMSIEDAAQRAGIGSETWRRYESGANIRRDKVRSVCGALRWRALPDSGATAVMAEEDDFWGAYDLKESECYVEELDLNFGIDAAKTFDLGSQRLLDQIEDDLSELARRPRGTHLGELDVSWLNVDLPSQWCTRYDYDFVFKLKATVQRLRRQAPAEESVMTPRLAQTIGEGLAIRLVLQQGETFAELYDAESDEWLEWYDAMVEPDWIIDFMYDELYTEDPGPCGFDNWFNPAVELPDMHDGVTPEMIEKVFGSNAPQDDGAQGEDK